MRRGTGSVNRLCYRAVRQMNQPSESLGPELVEWLEERGFSPAKIVKLPGDVSSRSYRRIVVPKGESMILVSYPPELRSTCERFHLTTRLLEGNGLRVPKILLADCQAGRMLLEDVGDVSLFNLDDQPWSELEVYLEQAVGIGRRIAQIEPEAVAAINPPLDESLLWSELEQTWETFLRPHGLIGSADCSREFEAGLRQLCARLGEEAPEPSHRDFMVRNLFLHGSPPSLVVLDHQDLRLAPRFYDLASLLNDSLFPPRSLESRLLEGPISSEEEHLSYRRATAQRTLKAVGTFASFAEAGDERHLRLISPTFARAADHLALIPETRAPVLQLREDWKPSLS